MSMADRDGVIWFNGQLVPWRDATVHVLTHTLHYGVGVFEGVRAYATPDGVAIFRLAEHTDRLINSAKLLHMKIPFDRQTLMNAQMTVIKENKLFQGGYLRPIVFYGPERMGLQITEANKVNVAIAAWEWGAYLGADGLTNGIRVKVSSYNRHHVNVISCKAKATGNYINSILEHQEASLAGCDEALLLDTQGYVAEGSGENLFLVKNGVVYTPSTGSCLNGITRETIITLLREHCYEVRETALVRDDVMLADEAVAIGPAPAAQSYLVIERIIAAARQTGDRAVRALGPSGACRGWSVMSAGESMDRFSGRGGAAVNRRPARRDCGGARGRWW